ncbi:hypothetical protein ACHAWU_005260 [Discostella pseudostelligera]|uniref:Uncharacterized protein n=1 Tax=Discostella pseudostelligera TaxID=259834 RepID=A0ABD3M3W1_9STRA
MHRNDARKIGLNGCVYLISANLELQIVMMESRSVRLRSYALEEDRTVLPILPCHNMAYYYLLEREHPQPQI